MFFSTIQKQLEFACENCSDFSPSHFPIQKSLFTFSNDDLIEYLVKNQEICELLISKSRDKRYTPSTIISFTTNGFIVGIFEHKLDFEFRGCQFFEETSEAVADYILLNWDLPRLRLDQTNIKLKRKWKGSILLLIDHQDNILAEIQTTRNDYGT